MTVENRVHLYKEKISGDVKKAVEKDRDKYIGGSDVGAILGLNPWKSAYTLWAEKVGMITPEDITDKEAVWWGVAEEALISKRFTQKTGMKCKRSGYSYHVQEYNWARAHIDRLIIGKKAGLECKSTSAFNKTKYADGSIPDAHFAQCQFYMWCTGFEVWYLATKQDHRFYVHEIERNDEFIHDMIGKCVEFWEHVESGIPPEVDGSSSTTETLNELYPDSNPNTENVDLAVVSSELDAIASITAQENSLKALKGKYQNTIKSLLGEAERGENDSYTVTWKTNARGSRVFKIIEKKEKRETE